MPKLLSIPSGKATYPTQTNSRGLRTTLILLHLLMGTYMMKPSPEWSAKKSGAMRISVE